MAQPWRDETVLRELLVERGMSVENAADHLDCHYTTVTKWKNRRGIETENDKYQSDSNHPWQDAELLEELYHGQKLNAEQIAEELDCSQSVVYKWMDKHDIESRSLAEARAVSDQYNDYPRPFTDFHGYEVFDHTHRGETDRFYHHRLLAVAKYGFDSVSDMQVHHKNRVKWDNRMSNIKLMDASEHQTHHLVNDRWADD